MVVSDTIRKDKTKAKKQDSQRKRDRRKQKSRALNAHRPTSNDRENNDPGSDTDIEIPNAGTGVSLDLASESTDFPSRKRQRVQEQDTSNIRAMDVDGSEEGEDSEVAVGPDGGTSPPSITEDPAKTEPALPTFPLPTIPDAPSKVDLAFQGLDRALVEAEIIDPSHVLPIPPDDESHPWIHLSEKMKKRLKALGIHQLFAVQTSLLPFLLQSTSQYSLYMPYNPPRDVCVSAPTGSGKTLAYAIPILEILSSRVVTRLRALVILPTRDLVNQVRETFETIAKGRSLKIGTATGQHSFAHEQSQLVADQSPHIRGGSSKVDILICTPGRLIDHLNGTPNFSLQHLRFLVIDEADRLLAQSFQDWLTQVLASIRPPTSVDRSSDSMYPVGQFIDCVSPAYSGVLGLPELPAYAIEKKESSCQKLLLSATLTRDPGKIAALELREPKYFIVQEERTTSDEAGPLNVVMERFSMPATLREHMVVCESSLKPLIFFHLVHFHSVTNALVFTKSAESTTRLVQLFQYLEESWSASDPKLAVSAYSSDLRASDRKFVLEKFKAQEIQILVCSDLVSRGIDIQNVSHVVNYDAPVDVRKYVHRVGRTARAGRVGDAWTLVEEQEVYFFKHMLQETNHLEKVKKLKVSKNDIQSLAPHYEIALKKLKDMYTR